MKTYIHTSSTAAILACLMSASCTSFTSYSPQPASRPRSTKPVTTIKPLFSRECPETEVAAEPPPNSDETTLPDIALKSLGVPYFLPKGVLLVKAEYQKPAKAEEKRKYVITVAKAMRADPQAPQFLRIGENAMYDEKSQIKVQNGLLTTVNAEPNDRTADIIKTVVGTALDLAKIANGSVPALASAKSSSDEKDKDPDPEFGTFDVEIDPFDAASCEKAAEEMKKAGWSFHLHAWNKDVTNKALLTKEEAETKRRSPFSKPIKNSSSGSQMPGPVYRLPTPVVLELRTVPHENGKDFVLPKDAVNGGEGAPNRPEFILPVPGTHAYVPIKRGFMTQRTTNVGFTDGMPTDVSLTQPSPVLATVKLPADIVKMVGEALPAIVKVENKAAPITALDQIKAENAMLEQRMKQLEFEQKIRDLGGTP